MKKLSILWAAMMMILFADAQKIQEIDVPAAIKNTFQKQYPGVKKIQWEKENGNYEAGFNMKGTNYSVLLNALGNIMETEIQISIDALPSGTKDYVSKHYPGQKIKEASKITDAKGNIIHEAAIRSKELFFDDNGNFLKEVNNKND